MMTTTIRSRNLAKTPRHHVPVYALALAPLVLGAFAPAVGCAMAPSAPAARSTAEALLGNGLVISQVYGGGGNTAPR